VIYAQDLTQSWIKSQTWKSGLKVLFHFPDSNNSLVCCRRHMHVHGFKPLPVTLATVSSPRFCEVLHGLCSGISEWSHSDDCIDSAILKQWAEIKALNAEVSECLVFFAESICCVSSSTVVAPTLIKALTVFP